jgi:hypothetical protein
MLEGSKKQKQVAQNHSTKKPLARSSLGSNTEPEAAVIAKIAAMPEHYRALAGRIHALVLRAVPELQPTLWYGMPAYMKSGVRICFFRADKKYVTFGLTPEANHARAAHTKDYLLPSAWYLEELDDATEARLADIVRKAAT